MGGIALLKDLYREMCGEASNWKTKTPEASIRRLVQTSRRLKKLKSGLYCLSELHEKFISLSEHNELSKNQETREHNHSYFQGCLLKAGKEKGFCTYTPDRSKQFLPGSTLGDFSDFSRLPEFGYPKIIEDARTVDVIWFNQRRMPGAFYEVEMTTDMLRSLNKFVQLQDYSAKFIILAPEHRKGQFENKIKKHVYDDIRKRVDFWMTSELEDKLSKFLQPSNQSI